MAGTIGTDDPVARELDQRGYAIRPLLPPTVLDALAGAFQRLDLHDGPAVHRTFIDASRPVAREVDLLIRDALRPHLGPVLPDRDIVLATYVTKASGRGTAVDFHQDLTFTDERLHRGVSVWIPLVDVDRDRGGLALIAGSHRWTSGIRTHSAVVPGPTVPLQVELAAMATTHDLRAGDAVIYDTATIHGSAPNISLANRPAIVIVTVPRNAPIVHFIEDSERVEGFEVDDVYFCTHPFGLRPLGFATFEPWAPPVRSGDIASQLRQRS